MITAIKDGDGILSVSILCESFSMFAAPSSMRSLPPSLTSLEINVAHGHPPRQVKYVISSIVKSFVCISNNQTNWRKFGDLWCFYSVSCGVFIRWFVVFLFGDLWNNHSVCWRLTVRWFVLVLFGILLYTHLLSLAARNFYAKFLRQFEWSSYMVIRILSP